MYHQNFSGLKKVKMCHLFMILCISIMCWMHLGNAFAGVDWDHERSINHLVLWPAGSLKMAGLWWPCASNRLAPGSFTKCQAGFQEDKFFSKRLFITFARATEMVKPKVIVEGNFMEMRLQGGHTLGSSTQKRTTADTHYSHAVLGQRL